MVFRGEKWQTKQQVVIECYDGVKPADADKFAQLSKRRQPVSKASLPIGKEVPIATNTATPELIQPAAGFSAAAAGDGAAERESERIIRPL